MTPQRRLGLAGGEPEVGRTTLRVEPGGHRDRLDQRGLAGAVVADEERHARVELEPPERAQAGDDRQRERVAGRIDALLVKLGPAQEAGHRASFASSLSTST